MIQFPIEAFFRPTVRLKAETRLFSLDLMRKAPHNQEMFCQGLQYACNTVLPSKYMSLNTLQWLTPLKKSYNYERISRYLNM